MLPRSRSATLWPFLPATFRTCFSLPVFRRRRQNQSPVSFVPPYPRMAVKIGRIITFAVQNKRYAPDYIVHSAYLITGCWMRIKTFWANKALFAFLVTIANCPVRAFFAYNINFPSPQNLFALMAKPRIGLITVGEFLGDDLRLFFFFPFAVSNENIQLRRLT